VIYLNKSRQQRDKVKIVIGPGTGLGEAILNKSSFSPCYEVISCEGGHADFPPRSAEDFELYEFAKHYIEHSENVENERARGKVYRISMERVCAGPAVPLIYEFMKKKYPDLPRILEPSKHPNEIRSYDVI
jgi:glucokinase